MASELHLRCTEHPGAPAGWRCPDCSRSLCEECTALAGVAGTRLELCVHCDAVVQVMQVPGTDRPYRQLLRFAALAEVNAPVLFALGAAVVLPLGLFGALYPRGMLRPLLVLLFLAASVVTWTLCFFSMLHGSARAPESGSRGAPLVMREDVVQPALRGIPLAVGLLAPSLLWDAWRGLTAGDGLRDAVSWLLLVAAAALAPAGLLGLALGEGSAGVWRIGARVRQLGADYWRCALRVALCGLFAHLLTWTARSAMSEGRGLLHALCLYSFAALTLLLVARYTGLLLHAHAAELGYALPAEYRRPALPHARPRGVRKPPPPPPVRSPPRPLELAEDVSTAETTVESVTRALQVGDASGALSGYAALPDAQAALLSVEAHIAIGRAAVRTDPSLAVRALRCAATLHPQHPEAPRAWVLLARLHAERLGDEPEARALFSHVVAQYPGTPAAQFAAQQLQTLS